jgi:pimeloyl-ACP methyl ester carboxylesterase
VWHIDGNPNVVTVGIIRGREAVRAWLIRFPQGFRPLNFSVDRLLTDQNDVIAIGRFRHRVLPHESIVDSDYVIRFTIQDGLIIRYQIFEDTLLIAQARASAAKARTTRLNGTLYGWDDVGQGKPVIFLHGLFLDRSFWHRQLQELGNRRRCVSFDMPGHGISTWRTGLTLDGIAEDIGLWLEENNATPATIVGHSQGGMIALRLAARFPQLVDQLILVNTSAQAEPPERLPKWRKWQDALLGCDEERSAMFNDIQRLTTSAEWLASHPNEALKEHAIMMKHTPPLLSAALSAAVFERDDTRDFLADITPPVMVLSGALDQATPPPLGKEIAVSVPFGQAITISDAAHHLPAEAPEQVTKAILGDWI